MFATNMIENEKRIKELSEQFEELQTRCDGLELELESEKTKNEYLEQCLISSTDLFDKLWLHLSSASDIVQEIANNLDEVDLEWL